MRHLHFLGIIILLIFSGCTSDDDLGFPVTHGDKLVRYAFHYESKEHRAVDFIYNDQNQVVKTINKYLVGGGGIRFFYSYDDDGKLHQVYTSESKDNYFYDEAGRLLEIYYYKSSDGGNTFEKAKYYGKKFYYDVEGQLSRIEILYRDPFDPDSQFWGYGIKNYYFEWENGNIVKSAEYNRSGELAVTRLYEYDHRVNYRIQHPEVFGFHAEGLSQNNVVKETILDHLGYYPTVSCRTCKTKYKYNRSGKPVMHFNPVVKDSYTVLIYD